MTPRFQIIHRLEAISEPRRFVGLFRVKSEKEMRETANPREPITKQSLIWKDGAERLKKEQPKVADEITPLARSLKGD